MPELLKHWVESIAEYLESERGLTTLPTRGWTKRCHESHTCTAACTSHFCRYKQLLVQAQMALYIKQSRSYQAHKTCAKGHQRGVPAARCRRWGCPHRQCSGW